MSSDIDVGFLCDRSGQTGWMYTLELQERMRAFPTGK
jgi:hypothetical protein